MTDYRNFWVILTFFFTSMTLSMKAQVVPVLIDDFESYPGYQVCSGYTTDIQVYPTHGTNNSKGLRAFMNSFDSKDSLVTNWLKPLPSALFTFDFRIMEASALYPFIPATLNTGDRFSLLFTIDGQQWTTLNDWGSNNFTTITAFTRVNIPIPVCDSAKFKFLVTRTNNPNDYFVDIDNMDISNYFVGIDAIADLSPIHVYPTTFQNDFTILSEDERIKDYEVTDMQGKIELQGQTTGNRTSVLTSHLKPGLHLIRISNQVFRLVKTN